MLIGGPHTFTKSLYFARATNSSAFLMIDGETIIKLSDPAFTSATLPAGAGGTVSIGTFRISMSQRITLSADVYTILRWQVTAAAGAGATGRLRLNLLREGVALPGVSQQNGTTRAVDAIGTVFNEIFLHRWTETTFASGDRLDFVVDAERVAAGAGGTATIQMDHDPVTSGSESISEVNL